MEYSQKVCNSCICKYCINIQDCNETDERCNKCNNRNFKQIIYDCSLCENYKGE